MDEFGVEMCNPKKLTACVYTFSRTQDNYGEVLQYLATQEFLETQGIRACLIRDKYNGLSFLQYIKSKIAFIIRLRHKQSRITLNRKQYILKENREHPRRFEEFRKKYFRIHEVRGVKRNPPKADIYIAGSDQIWNSPLYLPYLDWGDAVRMSFASGFGKLSPDNCCLIDKIKPLLKRIDVVTVREDVGVEICQKAGISKVTRIMDPTLLLKSNDYLKYEEKVELPEKYILLYMIGNETNFNVKEVYDFAETKGMPVIYIASQGWKDDYPKTYSTIPEWLNIMRRASYVITNSFHGVALSIVYHKLFCSILLSGCDKRTNNRVETILKYCQLENRIYKNDLSFIDTPIDYKQVDSSISNNYNLVVSLLEKAKAMVISKKN